MESKGRELSWKLTLMADKTAYPGKMTLTQATGDTTLEVKEGWVE